MKRTATMMIGLMFVVGCGKTEPTKEQAKLQTEPDIESSVPEAKIEEDLPVESFSERLIAKTKYANELEAEFRFAEAAETWREIDALVTEKFGSESWQAANARLAGIVASVESNFDEAQLEKLKQIQQHQKQFLNSFKARDFEGAKKITDASTALTTELFGKQSPMYGKQMLQSASLNQKTGNSEEAISHYHAAIENLKSTFHARHPDIESAHQQLGSLYLEKEKFVPAISNLKASARLSAELWGEDSLQYAKGANQLGVAYHQAGQLEIAEKVFQASEVIRRRKLGPEHSLVAHSNLNLGIVCLDQKKFDLAAKHLARAVEGFDKEDKSEENMLQLARKKLATLHMAKGEPELAAPLLGDVVEFTYARLGSDHPQVAELQYRQGIALAKQGKYDEAEPIFAKALETQKTKLGESHASTINTMRAMALLLKQTRRTSESQNMMREIQRVSKASDSNEFQR